MGASVADGPTGQRAYLLGLLLLPILAAVATAPAHADAGRCAALPPIAGMRVTRATWLPAESPPALGAMRATSASGYCQIEAIIGTEIGTEYWLPDARDWNGRVLGVGVGGQAGSIPAKELARGVARGYVAMANDSGHKASDTHWLLGDPERAANYAGLANHRMALAARALLLAYYHREPTARFFIGCSGGGRQAMTEVERYPTDFDGVIAGAPGVNTPEMSARRMWEMGQHSRFGTTMTAATWAFVAKAAIAACDPLDGVKDGIVADPFACRFDPATLLCTTGVATASCLTPAQLAAVRSLYGPLHDETGRQLDDGILPGVTISPAPLPEPFTPGPTYLAVALFGDGVHHDPHWDAHNFRLADDLPAIDRVMDLHADDPNIDRFRAEGGKLILYQGLADPLVSAQSTIAYYETLRRRYGAEQAAAFARLFLVPGMGHCVGGGVPDKFGGIGGDAPQVDADHDMLSALEAWVDRHHAPARIVATQTTPPLRSRPLCAYPSAARYTGGAIDTAASFDCGNKVTPQ
jgi:feruloyl esterase